MNAVGAIPVHIDSKRWKAPRLPSSCLPSRGRRNVGGLQPTRFARIGRWVGAVENVTADTGNRLRITESNGSSSSAFETALTTKGCSERERGRD